ncbi:hypothetical protein AB0H34_37430 [Saccharopolyspora shandongensis]|uniref:hypothetical protein n=1 Tax=Saccharopolyspora shandongensis TaxID=418495 RepID=UPI0033E6EF00
MATEDEIAALLTELETLLVDLGLGFIVVQERVLAAEGLSQTPGEVTDRMADKFGVSPAAFAQDVDTRWRESVRRPARKPQLKKSDTVVTPLDVRDRLAILLDLVEVATAGTLAMERAVQEEFEELRRLAIGRSAPAVEPTLISADYSDWTEAWDGTVLFTDPPEAELRGQTLSSWKLPAAGELAASLSSARTVVDILDELRAQTGLERGDRLAPDSDASGTEDVWNLTRRRHDERG